QLAVRPSLVAHMRLLGGMRPRPRITAIAADHRIGESSLDRHGGERHRENLARATIVERGRKARGDAEAVADELVMAVGLVGATADDPVDVVDLEAGIGDGIAHRLDQKIEAGHARHLAEPAVASSDNGTDIAQFAGWFDHGSSLGSMRFSLIS